MTARKKPGGHPAKADPDVDRLFRTMKATVELVRDLDGKLTPDAHLNLRASALGLMHVYAELTGLPAPQPNPRRPTVSLYYQDDHVTLYHGDCLKDHREWLEADVLVTDPPYGSDNGMGYGRHGGNGREGGKAFRIANDSTTEVRDAALEAWGGKPVIAFGTPRLPEPPGCWDNRLVWDKREPGLNGGPWRYTHESIFVRGEGWKRTSASSFSILSYPSGNGSPEKKDHVHAKPIALMMRLIEAAPDGLIADPFSGSGSTLVAAKNLGRKVIGVELEEKYCEVIAKRCAQDVLDFGSIA